MPRHGEMFTCRDNEGVLRTFPVTMMREFAEKHHATCADIIVWRNMYIQPDHVEHIRKNMGIEQARLDRLCEPYLSQPLIGQVFDVHPEINKIAMDIIDGNHRMVKLREMGRNHTDCYLFLPRLWEQFAALFPAKAEMLEGNSQMLEYERMRDAARLIP